MRTLPTFRSKTLFSMIPAVGPSSALLLAAVAFGGAPLTAAVAGNAPKAVSDSATTNEDAAVLIDPLANDTDKDAGDALTLASVGAPKVTGATASVVVVAGRRVIRYVPAPHASGSDSFTYVVSDSTARTATGKVTVSVAKLPDAPVLALPGLIEMPAGAKSVVLPLQVADVDGDSLTLTVTVASGTLLWNPASGVSVKGGGSGQPAIVLSGKAVALAAGLAGLSYRPAGTALAPVALFASVTDGSYMQDATASIVAAGTVVRYGFDEGSGDSAGGGSSAFLARIAPGASWTTGFSGSAIRTSAAGWADAVGATALPIDGPFTFSVRVRTDVLLSQMAAGYPSIVAQQDWDGNAGFYLGSLSAHGDRIGVRVLGGTDQSQRAEITADFAQASVWAHLAAVSDGTTLRLYINGVEAGTAAMPAGARPAAIPLSIGWGGFEGAIDDLAFTGRALTAGEVAALAGPAPADAAPVISVQSTANAIAGVPLSIAAGATDDVAVTGVSWSIIAGPSNATISQPTSLGAKFTFKSAGAYVVRLSVSDAQRTVSRDVRVQASGAIDLVKALMTLDKGLVADWTFEDGSGVLVDDITLHGHDGAISGGVAWTTDGASGGALSFPGNDAAVVVPDSVALRLSTFTLAAWVRPQAVQISPFPAIISKQSWSGNAGFLLGGLQQGNGTFGVRILGGADITQRAEISVDPLPAGTWSHLAASYDGEQLRVFRNGAQVASRTASGVAINQDAIPLMLGWFYRGDLDGVRIYDRALPKAEMQLLGTLRFLAGNKAVLPTAAN